VSKTAEITGIWHRHEAGLLAVVSVVVIAGSVIGGRAFFRIRETTNFGSARCYTVSSYGQGKPSTGTTITAGGRTGSAAQGESALSVCAMLWRQGFLNHGTGMLHPSAAVADAAEQPVPALAACTLPDGTAGIFPEVGPFTCGKLGLASPPTRPAQ